ncbi:MAG: fucose isomerase [bacterium]
MEHRIGIISFTDPRAAAAHVEEREKNIKNRHTELANFLAQNGISVIDPLAKIRSKKARIYGIATTSEVEKCARILNAGGAMGVIVGCWHWTEPQLICSLVRSLNIPVMLYTADDPQWAGAVHISATGAALWEMAPNRYALTHGRVIGQMEELLPWVKAVCALAEMRAATLLLWGGSYCLRMNHLRDDEEKLKTFIIGDIVEEGQYLLIRRAEKILGKSPERLERFRKWLRRGGAKLVFDPAMLTEESFLRQVALYLAARDRLKELQNENIAGVSIRCQPELSEEWGVTGCLLPSFLPFGHDSEGAQPVVPTVCEGDIKGLLTVTMLHKISGAPPLFGDLKYIGDKHIIISNCGGSSVYYAAPGESTGKTLTRLTFAGQCQGKSGAAVGYEGAAGEDDGMTATFARMIRVNGQYFMQVGAGRIVTMNKALRGKVLWGDMWPHVAVETGVSQKHFARIAGSNHYCLAPGDLVEHITHFCEQAGITPLHIDSDEAAINSLQILHETKNSG